MNLPHAWFALAVKPRHEKVVARNLATKELEVFLPLYRDRRSWSDRVKSLDLPLFPSYVFCRFDYGERLRVLNTPGVHSIVGTSAAPTPVGDAEIAALQAIVATGLPARPWPYLRMGAMVRVEAGALCGMEGRLVREKDAWRVVVSVDLLRRSVAVEIDRSLLVPLPARREATRALDFVLQSA